MYIFAVIATLMASSCSGSESPADSKNICVQRNGYLKVSGHCDSYVECKEFEAVQMMCPDGLHYDPSVQWPNYPCGYPSDVQCNDRGDAQPADPTSDCPHQYGFFPSPLTTPTDCGHYRQCVAGQPHEMLCPSGLAFNPSTSRCDWADLVSTCNVPEFLGFKCPPATYDESKVPVETNHKFEGHCYSFYSCSAGLPRLLSCDAGFAFDPAVARCVDADKVDCSRNRTEQPPLSIHLQPQDKASEKS
ncbi:protein obstructor-E-like [Leptidea sinapis]|uniref:protein obstructor-E-like n=1 Tax=Leptidea sinapis TaxID=189913 RepID=UPI0021C2BD9A|nr:protein obstructor-E-like [Leptidea sinapis]